MQRFKEFLKEDIGRGYCYVSPDKRSAQLLVEWAVKDAKLNDIYDMSELHCTLIYDDRNKKFDMPMAKQIYTGKPKQIKMLGDNNDVLTILLESKELTARHNDLIKAGYFRTYESYLPHVSLKTDATKEDFRKAKKAFGILKEKLKTIKFTNEKWKLIEHEE